jgi:hypothetical protein
MSFYTSFVLQAGQITFWTLAQRNAVSRALKITRWYHRTEISVAHQKLQNLPCVSFLLRR